MSLWRPWKGGGPSIPYPFNYFENIPYPKNKYGKYPQNSESMYTHIPKIDPSIPYPFKYLQKYPVSL